MSEMQFVYELECKEGKRYVGQTGNIIRRFKEHKSGEGAVWTTRYTALSMTKLEETSGKDFKELAWTLEAMSQHGIQNVRGGPFCRTELTGQDIKTIVDLMKSNAYPGKWTPMDCDRDLFNEDGDVESPKSRRERTGSRKGLLWTEKEDDQLFDEMKQGMSLADIAKAHSRSESSIYERRKCHIRKLTAEGLFPGAISTLLHIDDIDIIARALA
jgi:predicted GIY-YIG superfamily endonuclease